MNYDFFLIFDRIVRLLSKFEPDSRQGRRFTSNIWLLLSFINSNNQVTGTDVARRFMIKPPTATQLIDRAVKKGYILRNPSDYDRRVQYLALTPDGEKQRQVLGKLFDEHASRALKYLSKEERQYLLILMNKMAHGLENETNNKRIIHHE